MDLDIYLCYTSPMEAKYLDIYQEIKKRIDEGIYETGQKIPDEFSLCEEFSCSRMTLKKALDLIVAQGLLYRRKGQGSFVMANTHSNRAISLSERDLDGFFRTSKGQSQAKVLHFSLEFAQEKIAKMLSIQVGDPVYDIQRVRLVDKTAYVIEHTYMPTAVIPGINLDILHRSVYEYIENKLGLKIASAQRTMRAQKSNQVDQKELQLQPDEPVLEIEELTYLDNGTPFSYSISRHRYDLFEFTSFAVRR